MNRGTSRPSIHPSAWKGNSRKSICRILQIEVYEGGAKQHSPAPMDRMLPQDVVGLDKDAPRCIEAHRVDLHQRRGLHQFPRIAFEVVLTPLLAASLSELLLIGLLGSLPLWSFHTFAPVRIATPASTSLNVTFAGA